MERYIARGILRNGHTNSILAGSVARKLVARRLASTFCQQAQNKIIHAGHDIRLSALYNRQKDSAAPTVVLLHGWLGCADSLYLMTLGAFLYQHGFHVVRLNLRDHGGSHHLNQNLFHSCRIQEVINACRHIQQEFQQPLSLIGFSLGANFALRVNAYTTADELTLKQTIAFCPVIDPRHTLHALENTLLVYRNYFMQRWRAAYYKKVEAFPSLYCKSTFDCCKTLRQATENLATRHAGFQDLDSYLDGYSIAGNRLSTLHAPAQVILAQDDPIIPWKDVDKLAHTAHLKTLVTEHGGHCGFLEPDLTSPWVNHFSLSLM